MAESVKLRASDLAARTGLSENYFYKLAASGAIDWASQPGGPYSTIIFEEDGFERWYEAGRKKKRRQSWGSTGGASGRGAANVSKAMKFGSPLEQRMREKLKAVTNNG